MTHRAPDGTTKIRPASYRSVFAVGEYRPLFGSYVLSTVGDELARLALTVLVYQRTESPLLAAITFGISYLPWIVGGPVLAALADRLPRHRVLITSDVVRAVLVTVMAVPGMPLPVLLALLLLVSVCNPPFEAARSALSADILTDDRYAVATSLVGIVQQVAQVVGFLVGGALVATVSPSFALLVNAATFALSALWLTAGLHRRPAPQVADGETPGSVWSDVLVGLRYVAGVPRLVAIVAVLWVGTLLVNAHEGISPALSEELVGSTALVGVLLAANPVGVVIGGVVVGRFCPPHVRERLLVPLVLVSVGALLLAGLSVRVLDGTAAVVAFAALLAVSGIGSSWTIPLNVAFVQAVPPAYRGRAFGVAIAGMSGSQGLGALLAGAAATSLLPTTVVVITGAFGLVLILAPLVALVRTRPPADAPFAGPSQA